ncbi:MAG TPA: hypothetical protein VFZ09_01165 [Archangium sp.]|uniref:hypothetical protein n=1 Tax=Archangium sp. TaxID=1872627 RepID=UPI002E379899|nr:hypothetical protein [Archangium sp.]HEX5744818.1 hypothetical protein [Archangium sp.]
MLKHIALAALLSLATACTADPEAGDKCTPEGGITCDTTTSALFCEGGVFRAVPCRGGAGCVAGQDRGVCDLTKAQAGDACPASAANSGQCDAANPNQLLKCTGGTWTAQACKSCSTQAGGIYCVP